MYQRVNLTAGVAVEFQEAADFFRVLESPFADATVIFYMNGKEVARAENIGEGYFEKFNGSSFDKLSIKSTAGGWFEFVMRYGNEVGYDKFPAGDVNVLNNQGAFAHAQETVTNASTTIVAGNAARRYLLIQNNDPAGNIWVRADGGVATQATGIKIPPGGNWEIQGYVPTGAINAIGDIASNANVVSVEG